MIANFFKKAIKMGRSSRPRGSMGHSSRNCASQKGIHPFELYFLANELLNVLAKMHQHNTRITVRIGIKLVIPWVKFAIASS